jgi:hypothetical protein
MKNIVILLSFVLLGLVAEAGPKIELFGGCKRSVAVSLTNCDNEPYFYHSQFVNDLPYVIEIKQGDQTRTISENLCGTGATWNRLEPKSSIRVEIRLTPEATLPSAKALLLIFDSSRDGRHLVAGSTVDMAEAIRFLRDTGLDKADELSAWSASFVGDKDFEQALAKKTESEANKALVPTVMSVTPAADAPVAPATTAAHL